MTRFITLIALLVFSLPAFGQNAAEPRPNPVVLSVHDPLDPHRISFSLRRDEYEQGVASAGGNARAYLRGVLLNQFLDWEYEKAFGGFSDDLVDVGRQIILNVLIEQALKKAGRGWDDWTPMQVKQKYDFYAMLFHRLQKEYEPYPDASVLDELVQGHPVISPLIIYPRVQLQGVAFTLFPLEKYRELGASQFETAKEEYGEMVRAVLSNETEALQRMDVMDDFRERLRQAVGEIFERGRQLFQEESMERRVPSLAVAHVLGVAISEYVVAKQSLFSDQELSFLNQFLDDLANDLNQKMKALVLSRLNDSMRQFYELYLHEIRNTDTAEEKADAFKRAFDEARRRWPLRMVYIQPGWAEQGRGELLPEIEKLSTGIHRKQASELYHYVSGDGPQPMVALFQWMGYRPPRLLALDEKSVFEILKDALFLNAYRQIKPDVESRLLKKYRYTARFSGVFDFDPYTVFD